MLFLNFHRTTCLPVCVDFVPRDRIVQRAYSKRLPIHGILEVSALKWCPFQGSCKSTTCYTNAMILILL